MLVFVTSAKQIEEKTKISDELFLILSFFTASCDLFENLWQPFCGILDLCEERIQKKLLSLLLLARKEHFALWICGCCALVSVS